jgi:hypothetical protein
MICLLASTYWFWKIASGAIMHTRVSPFYARMFRAALGLTHAVIQAGGPADQGFQPFPAE